nr:MAG TPA: hypothetical protein [Caudoviricetes sp.]
MAPSSHSPKALSSPRSVTSVAFARGAFGAADSGLDRAHGGGVEGPPEQVCPSSQIVFSRVAREPLERDVSHIVMFLTWLLESPSECEIAHMVPRAGTLVPIS